MFETGECWKDNKWNEFIIWLHRRILNFASWILNFADTYPCEESPPFSDAEIQDLEESNKEYESGEMPVFDNVEDFISDLEDKRNNSLRRTKNVK